MKTLLQIRSSLEGANGTSSRLADEFVAHWLSSNPRGLVNTRDLAADPVPHLSGEVFRGFRLPPEQRTPEQLRAAQLSDRLIAELQSADEIVFAVPMYNFSVPSTLRSYFDYIARAGITFRYTAAGPEGLIRNKQVYVLIARGGIYSPEQETQTAYLQQILGFIGLRDARFIYAEGLGLGEEVRTKSLTIASRSIAALFRSEATSARAA